MVRHLGWLLWDPGGSWGKQGGSWGVGWRGGGSRGNWAVGLGRAVAKVRGAEEQLGALGGVWEAAGVWAWRLWMRGAFGGAEGQLEV